MSDRFDDVRRWIAEGRYASAAEELRRRISLDPEDDVARQLLRFCVEQYEQSRLQADVPSGPEYAKRVYTIIVALGLPWMALLAALLITLGRDHYLVPAVAGAAAIFFPFAATIAMPDAQPRKATLERITVLIAVAWLAVSTLWMFTNTQRPNVVVAYTGLMIGSIIVPLIILWKPRRAAP